MNPATARRSAKQRASGPRTRGAGSVILLNKPYGTLCQFSADGSGKPTLKEWVPVADVYPAGRLDADSEGLVVLTADGALQAWIASPRGDIAKTYWVQVEGVAAEEQLAALAHGIDVGEFVASPARVRAMAEPTGLWPRTPPIRFRKALPTSWLELELREGRNRQVRRMTAAAGLPTLRLIRYAVGPWTLDGLPPGAWRRDSVPAHVLSSRPVR